MFSTVMTFVEADEKPEHRVQLSASLANRLNATLIGVTAAAFRSPVEIEAVPVQGITELDIKETSAKLASQGHWFRGIAGATHRKLEWRPVFDFPVDALAREARSADLVVIGRRVGPDDPYTTLDPGEAILRMGRPTLVVPQGVNSLRAQHVVIGWKDTREARRAVRDALPLLRDAKRVSIVEICGAGEEDGVRTRLDDVTNYLTRHRVSTGARVILHREQSAATQLIQLAQDESADLLVTGAYGHSRLGEWIFGGMTHDLLAGSPICCLMSY